MQNESLNGGGTLFVDKHPNLKVRVVHGNTLTAAVILNEIPGDVKEVFLTGATSKLGRAIALYLCRRKVRVLVSTTHPSQLAIELGKCLNFIINFHYRISPHVFLGVVNVYNCIFLD